MVASHSNPATRRLVLALAFVGALIGLPSRSLAADSPANGRAESPLTSLVLKATASVDSRGVFLDQIASAPDQRPLPAIRLCPGPTLATPLNLTRARIEQILAQPEFGLSLTNWSGAPAVLVSRRLRPFEELEMLQMLSRSLQERCARDRGELELRLGRPWNTAQVPDEDLSLRLLDLPTSGLCPLMLVRFELLAGTESVGTWQALVQARLWREIWVTRAPLRRGQGIGDSDVGRERRDILSLRDVLADPASASAALQVTENVPAGAALLQRHLRLQPVVFRGQAATATLADGLLNLVIKVEVLEDGAPGQVVRLRNATSRRELRGKVHNENSIVVVL